jgi:predicted RNA-binding Zn-ribbon protein involved in translation (DUF1610 family)
VNRSTRRAARGMVSRSTGRPMVCPQCGNDVYVDAPHVCPPGFVQLVPTGFTFYGYNSLNKCCQSWILLGWPQIDGAPKLEGNERGRMGFNCPKCTKRLWFDIAHPEITTVWDTQKLGPPQPPALVAGRIRAA